MRKVLDWYKRLTRKQKSGLWLCIALLFAFWFCLPSPLFKTPSSFVLEDYKGRLLSASIADDGQWRFPAGDSVPEKFKKCILAFEDKRFYYHPGVDILSIARAMRENISAGRVVSGGSTITMQVIRLSRTSKRNFGNKLIEAIQALRLELGYSKEEILGLYAANAPFGTNVVGLEAASWRYFARPAAELSWGEMASLAVLPNSPSLVHPGRNRAVLIRKRNRLINALQRVGILSAEDAALARLEPVPEHPLPLPQIAPHLLDLARKDFRKGNSRETRIRTSIRMDLQERVNTVLLNHQGRLAANGVNNLAALVLDVHTGKAVAYIGNIYQPQNTEIESHVDIIQARRSPGSTLKPLLYAAMLNEGYILPNTLVPDIPTQIAGYQPNNYDLGYDGAVPASKALARSLNVPAVRMLQQYKYSRFYSMLKSCGISTLNKPADFYGLSIILGGCEVSMWELAGVYASMARRLEAEGDLPEWSLPGYHLETAAPTGGSGEVSYDMGRAATWYTFEAMNEVMRPGEEQLWQRFESSQRIAWKTGTSFGFRDAWALGLTPDHVVVVWAGNADGEGRPGLTGIDAAAPIMFDIFRLLPAATRWFRKPQKEMVRVRVCSESGMRAVKGCAHQAEMWLPSGALKAPVCPYNRLVHLDKTGKWQVTDRCMAPSDMIHRYWFVLPPAMEYYYKTKNYGYKPLPLFLPGCDEREQSEKSAMELIYPRNNAEVYIPVEIGGSRGQMIFTAAHSQEGEPVFWHLDHRYIGKTEGPHQMAFSPSPGLHTITLVDRDGNRLEQTFRVLDKERN